MLNIFWVGSEIPKFILENIDKWRSRVAEIQIWDDTNVELIIGDLDVDKNWPKAMLVDLLRVKAVHKFGGWYCDADTIPAVLELPHSSKVTLIREESRRFWNGAFQAPKNHRFLDFWENEIVRSIKNSNSFLDHTPTISGPHALSRALYGYFYDHGIHESGKEFEVLPWGSVLFTHSQRKFRKRKLAKAILVHCAANTWRFETNLQRTKKSRISESIFSLRQTNLSSVLDITRHLIKNPHRFPIRYWQLLMILSMDNKVLDSDIEWKDFWIESNCPEMIRNAVMNLKIGGIRTTDLNLQIKLKDAGWKAYGPRSWIRPNVTRLFAN